MRSAFTLIESLISIGIVLIIGVIAFILLFGSSRTTNLNGTTQQVVALLREAQIQSATQNNGMPWGVHFENPIIGDPFYALFTGDSYASGTVQGMYRLPNTIGFVNWTIPIGASEDIKFAPISGATTGITVIQLRVISQPFLYATIVVEPNGAINLGSTYVYVADAGNHRIQKLSSDGIYISGFPIGVTIDSIIVNAHGIYVADINNNQIRHLSLTGALLNAFGSTGSGNGQFQGPYQIALDSSGNLFAVDHGNNRVEKFDGAGNYISQLGCPSGPCPASSGDGQFNSASNMAIDGNDNIYVTDIQNNRVEKFNSSSVYQFQFGGCPSGACATSISSGFVNRPTGVAVDPDGNVFISDSVYDRVEKFNRNGKFLLQFGSTGTGDGQLSRPGNLAIDAGGNVYVSDLSQNRVEKFTNDGVYIAQFGCPSGACPGGSGEGQFISPQGMTVAVY